MLIPISGAGQDARIVDGADGVQRAAEVLRSGALAAFSTETVYGLGADATNDEAVARIFEAKGRPKFNPLIIHAPDVKTVKSLVDWNERAEKLATAFWPGPLTFVLSRSDDCPVSLLASAGLETLAVRLPSHELAQSLLKEAGCPVAAPSANKSGHVSPTTAHHVAGEFGEEVSVILDGGPCQVGLESAVVDLSSGAPALLRPGGISRDELEAVIGPVDIATPESPVKSPGMLERHYAPSTPLRLNAESADENEVLLGFGPEAPSSSRNLSAGGNLVEAAANLFAYLRELDAECLAGIAVMPIPESGLGAAINDRLRRAATSS